MTDEGSRLRCQGEPMKNQQVIDALDGAIPGLAALYRFGSQASGHVCPGSDLDLAILAPDPLPSPRRFDLAQDIAALVGRDVDLVDLRTASTVMQMQVITTGECLYSRDEGERQRFETCVYSSYARLNEERQEILKDIRERGLVYAR